MKKYKMVVLSNAKDGREDEYNEWYSSRHLSDVVQVPGFVSAQRFKLKDDMGFAHHHRYLAIYEIESDDPHAVVEELVRRQGSPAMVISDALDLEGALGGVFEVCSALVTSGPDGAKS